MRAMSAGPLGRRVTRGDILLERRAYFRTTAMEQDPLVRVTEVEQLTDFIRGEAIDVAQGDDFALGRAELATAARTCAYNSSSSSCCSGWAARRRYEPVSRPALRSRPEAVWVDGWVECSVSVDQARRTGSSGFA